MHRQLLSSAAFVVFLSFVSAAPASAQLACVTRSARGVGGDRPPIDARALTEGTRLTSTEAQPMRRVVRTAESLLAAAAEMATTGGTIVVARDADIVLPVGTTIQLTEGMALVGERGVRCRRPVLRKTELAAYETLVTVNGANVRIEGLRLQGPAREVPDIVPGTKGVLVTTGPALRGKPPVVIRDNEIDHWSGAAVDVRTDLECRVPAVCVGAVGLTSADAGMVRIERNFLHHNPTKGLGYGVVVGKGGRATIEGNVFDFNRHHVTSDGWAFTGYVVRRNYAQAGTFKYGSYWGQHFDVHGTDPRDNGTSSGYGGQAGDYYEITRNTVRGTQGKRKVLVLRGTPVAGLLFAHNIMARPNVSQFDPPVSLKDDTDDRPGGNPAEFHLDQRENIYDTDYASDLATGDFDGDGRTDLFVATGTAWFISRAGTEPWEFLRASDARLGALAFADIDGDGVTDVLLKVLGAPYVFASGTRDSVPFTPMPGEVPIRTLRRGDFDGDGRDDLFYTWRGEWHVWYGTRRVWQLTQTSNRPMEELRFGEFDGRRGTDVLTRSATGWVISSGATGAWTPLNTRAGLPIANIAVADLDGDGTSDVLVDDGGGRWRWSRRGREALTPVRVGGQTTSSVTRLPMGRFGDAGTADVVLSWGIGPAGRYAAWDRNFFTVWDLATRQFRTLSREAMR